MYEALCGIIAHNRKNIGVANWKTEKDWKSIIWVPRRTLQDAFILLCACVYWKDSCLLRATQLCVGLLSCKEVETLLLPSCGQAPDIVSELMKSWQVSSSETTLWWYVKESGYRGLGRRMGSCWMIKDSQYLLNLTETEDHGIPGSFFFSV